MRLFRFAGIVQAHLMEKSVGNGKLIISQRFLAKHTSLINYFIISIELIIEIHFSQLELEQIKDE